MQNAFLLLHLCKYTQELLSCILVFIIFVCFWIMVEVREWREKIFKNEKF